MAVRIDAAADYLSRTATLPTVDPMSACFWFKLASDRNTSGWIFQVSNNIGTIYQALAIGADGTTLNVATSGPLATAGTSLSVGTWYHLGYTRNGSSHIAYLNGVQDATLTSSISLTPFIYVIGGNSVNWVDGTFYAFKSWSGVELTAAEIKQEMQTVLPKRFDSLWAWTPLFKGASESLKDYSSNARDWTANGTLTDEDAPPISWGARILSDLYKAPYLEQEGYRFRNDDGSETTATWRQSQDTADSVALSTTIRLRILVNTGGDASAQNFQLEVKRSTDPDGAYRRIAMKQ